ncbi:protein FAR1-RELATED SEQUENCE 5-like [Salvia splendens]|uniref:protein FAR1-RELATED SEQUENCE 5-like n=1 Tax=Salvia splendens TaxID=180675 RepID=UPI001C264121|nr:protein FAR1-RELATED SEQUENCE 5-like [Salvia splendens]
MDSIMRSDEDYFDSDSSSSSEEAETSKVVCVPKCPDELKPKIGQSFMNLDRALDFYNNYARYVGFDTRKKGSKKEKDVTTWIYVVCSREGTKQRNSEQSEVKRKRSSIKCYCNAKVSWKYIMGVGYVIQSFVEEHNHEMVEERHKRFMNLNRNLDLVHQKFILDCANANIGPTLSFSLLKEVLGGLDYVGCTVLEVRNYRRDLRAYVEGADAQMLLNELRRKKELCSAFTYEYEVNSKDRMTRLFWCDPTGRRNYHLYGDIVSFDTTYSTNRYCMIFAPFTGKDNHGRPVTFAAGLLSKENANSFSWLFNQFVKCMGVAPKLIVTDQDLGMKVAVEEVLVNTRHRWCMWHVMVRVEQLKKELNACVWSELIEPDAFEETWHAIMERYGLTNNVWFSSMFASRKFWVPAFFRDFPMSSLIKTTSISESQNNFFKRYSKSRANLMQFYMNYNHALETQRSNSAKLEYYDSTKVPILRTGLEIEKHASTIYSGSAYTEIQEEIVYACFSLSCATLGVSTNTDIEVYDIKDKDSNSWTVTYSIGDDTYLCGCKKFERLGLLCSHIFCVLKHNFVKLIPEKLHGGRWLKSQFVKPIHGGFCDDQEIHLAVDKKKIAFKNLYGLFIETAQSIEGNIDQINAFAAIIEEGRKQLLGEDVVLSSTQKRAMIENFYGSHVPNNIEVHPPEVVSTKRSGSGKKSKRESTIKLAMKPGRKCGNCHEIGHHDSRNCKKVNEK